MPRPRMTASAGNVLPLPNLTDVTWPSVPPSRRSTLLAFSNFTPMLWCHCCSALPTHVLHTPVSLPNRQGGVGRTLPEHFLKRNICKKESRV